MKKSSNTILDSRPESSDINRRLYKGISDVARYLDDRRGCAEVCSDLFSPILESKRVKIREYCEKLIFFDPIGYGRKGEELLWRKAFYDVVSTAKRLRKDNTWSPTDIAYMERHLSSAVGFYQHIVLRLQTEYKLDLRGLVDFPFTITDDGLRKGKNMGGNRCVEAKETEWALEAVHRCLVYLGDISRYLLDLHPSWDTGLPVRYYLQALNMNCDIGTPHNQLGTLSGTKNHSVDAAYNFMRCLSCPRTFEGSEGNLVRIFQRNAMWLQNYCSTKQNGKIVIELPPPAEHIHRLLARFLLLIDVWYFDKTAVPNMPQLCQQILQDLQHCLTYVKPFPLDVDLKEEQVGPDKLALFQDSEENYENPEYLKDEVVFKMVVMSLMCVKKLHSCGSQQLSAVVAFTAAVFSQLVQQVAQHIKDSVLNLSLPLPPSPSESTPGEVAAEEKLRAKQPGRLRGGRRRRRRQSSSEDSDLSDGDCSYIGSISDEDNESDMSENEEPEHVASSDEDLDGQTTPNIVASNGSVEAISINEHATKINDGKMVNGINKKNNSVNISSGVAINGAVELAPKNANEDVPLNAADVLELVAEEGLLEAVKVCTDWLRSDQEVIRACGRSSRTLLVRVVTLLNLINVDFQDLEKGSTNWQVSKLKNLQEMFKKIPVPEDVVLKGLPLLKEPHKSLDWNYLKRHCLTTKEEALLRAYKLVDFGHLLCSIPDTGVAFDAARRTFTISAERTPSPSEHVTSDHMVRRDKFETRDGPDTNNKHKFSATPSSSSRHGQLMHSMGQLWLRAEVHDLESRVRHRGPTFSPYLAVDSDALIHHMPLVKQLVGARKFIILIPTVVVSALDELKREFGRARETIRWLESQFQRGNRFLRAQRMHERLPLPLIKYPKKKDREAWLFFQVVECCLYFSQQPGVHKPMPDTALVTLLTGQKSCLPKGGGKDDPVRGYSSLGVAKSAGINLEYIESFHSKWKMSSKSHG